MERRREYSTGNYVDSLQEPQVRFLQVPLKTVVKYSGTLSSELRALKTDEGEMIKYWALHLYLSRVRYKPV